MDSLGTFKTLKINNVVLTTCSRGLIEMLIVSYLVKKLPASDEPEGSLPCYLVAVVSPTNPFHAFPSYFFKIRFNIILLYTPRCSKRSVSFRFHHQARVPVPHVPLISISSVSSLEYVARRSYEF